ncbi:hypothetical protein BV22DRAFT_904917 [Leucogyrophana mollusca]|uniref:Uncharacterized protein n=1 Tax=Leucogyrophana mollusca TaxID=85980 RepID=A0ACB8AZ56_9AGAM|nr:hypothetical protein BV22DRAFT_904917 [Leucogyrophana mollusca]
MSLSLHPFARPLTPPAPLSPAPVELVSPPPFVPSYTVPLQSSLISLPLYVMPPPQCNSSVHTQDPSSTSSFYPYF